MCANTDSPTHLEDDISALRGEAHSLSRAAGLPEGLESVHVRRQSAQLLTLLLHETPADAFHIGEVYSDQLPSILRV